MSRFVKIILIVLAVLPLWMTIVAFGQEMPAVGPDLEKWRNYLNLSLLNNSSYNNDDLKIQITEIVPAGALAELKPELMQKKVVLELNRIQARGSNNLGLRYYDEQGRLVSIFHLPVKLFIQKKVPVAAKEIVKGSLIDTSDFDLKWVDAASFRKEPSKSEEIRGRQARSNISFGSVIYPNFIQSETVIKKGDRINIKVLGKGISISTAGIAQEAGSEGETIKILNTDSQREIYAVVVGDRQAEVRL